MRCHFLKEEEGPRGLRRKAIRKTNAFDFKKINVCVYFVQKNENVHPLQKAVILHWKEGRKKETEVPQLLIALGKVSKMQYIFSSLYYLVPTNCLSFCRLSGKRAHSPVSSTLQWRPLLTYLPWVFV